MIFSKLHVLLAERNLKISKVAKDTGISRTTLTALAQNTSQGIQFETLNVLCGYLGITPDLFFEYIPYTIKISATELMTDKNKVITNTFNEYKIDKKGIKIDFSVNVIEHISNSKQLISSFNFVGINQKEFEITKEKIGKNGRVGDASMLDIKLKDDNGFQKFIANITQNMPVTSRVYIINYINNKINEEVIKIINNNIKSKLLFKISTTKRVIDSFNRFFD